MVGITDWGCLVEQYHSSCDRATGKYVATQSQRATSSSDGKAVSQRRFVDVWVVEVAELPILTAALFGKVTANKVVSFVFHNLGFNLGWAGILDK